MSSGLKGFTYMYVQMLSV